MCKWGRPPRCGPSTWILASIPSARARAACRLAQFMAWRSVAPDKNTPGMLHSCLVNRWREAVPRIGIAGPVVSGRGRPGGCGPASGMTGLTRNGVSSRPRLAAILRDRVDVLVRGAAMPCQSHSRQRQVAGCCSPSTSRQAVSTRIRSARSSFTASPSAHRCKVSRSAAGTKPHVLGSPNGCRRMGASARGLLTAYTA
jgi:hypothetical protein